MTYHKIKSSKPMIRLDMKHVDNTSNNHFAHSVHSKESMYQLLFITKSCLAITSYLNNTSQNISFLSMRHVAHVLNGIRIEDSRTRWWSQVWRFVCCWSTQTGKSSHSSPPQIALRTPCRWALDTCPANWVSFAHLCDPQWKPLWIHERASSVHRYLQA